MKSLLKFALLSALIITGKLAKQSTPAAMAQTPTAKPAATANNSVILVNQVLPSKPVKPARKPAQPQQSGSGLIAEMF